MTNVEFQAAASQYMAYLTASMNDMAELQDGLIAEMTPDEARRSVIIATGMLKAALRHLEGVGELEIQKFLRDYSMLIAKFDTTG